MVYATAAWERAMTVREVMLRAISGEIHWFQAADILGTSARSLRRYRRRMEKYGYDGLVDHRRRSPSLRRVAADEVKRILTLYRDRYRGWNVQHFYETAKRNHGVTVSYTFVKQALQGAGLVMKRKARGRHRRRRERKACFGEMLHLDGSKHAWLALVPEERQTLIAIVDDATSRVLYAQLWPEESTLAVLSGLREVVETHGIPASLYTDRAGWAFETPKAGDAVSKTQRTQVGEVLHRLGIQHIPSYSPQGRGRSERMNGTLQGRVVNELKLAGACTITAANEYLRKHYLPIHNQKFSVEPRDSETAFVGATGADLDEVFSREFVRHVGKDNVVTCGKLTFQIERQNGRRTCAGMVVIVRQRMDGTWTIRRGPHLFGRYDANGRPMEAAGRVENRKRPRFPTTALDRGKRRRGPQLPQGPAANV